MSVPYNKILDGPFHLLFLTGKLDFIRIPVKQMADIFHELRLEEFHGHLRCLIWKIQQKYFIKLTKADDYLNSNQNLAMLHYTVNQRLHWACRQYGHSGGTRGWLGVERCQLCLQDTSRSAKWHRRAAVGHWVSLCVWSVVGWLIVYQDGDYLYPGQYSQTICRSQIGWYRLWGRNILMARSSTFLESRPWWWGHDYRKFIHL